MSLLQFYIKHAPRMYPRAAVPMQVSVINYPNLGQDTGLELLTWFHTAGAAAAGDGSEAQPAHLQLPATISKDERRDWHRLAEQTHCHSLSQVRHQPAGGGAHGGDRGGRSRS